MLPPILQLVFFFNIDTKKQSITIVDLALKELWPA
jgi:hypothetical protein